MCVFRHGVWTIALAFVLTTTASLHAQGVSTWLEPASTQPASSPPRPLPATPGHYKFRFQTSVANPAPANHPPGADQGAVKLSYELYLPVGYDKNRTACPMIVFLNGAGECGDNLEGIMVHGPSSELVRNPKLAAHFPCIVLSPQCPGGKRWDTPGMVPAVAALIREVEARYRVDRDRVYLTGLSLGGEGTWLLALTAPELFAAIAPISAVAVEPRAAAGRLKGIAIWIIVGTEDGGFTEGSRRMTDALVQAGLDATLTEVPGEGHGAWDRYYPKPGFYDWLLANRRGRPPAPDRLSPAQLIALGLTDTPDMQAIAKLSAQFKKFLPYWQLLNCGPDNQPGLRPEFNGHTGVFVTNPLNRDIPAMLQTTWTLTPGRKAALHLQVGRDPKGAWQLSVRADSKEVFSQAIDATTTPTGWADLSVDLSAYAGQAVRLEVLNRALGDAKPSAYWGRVQVDYR
jgi:pimeloyl-ACP methyl ester carboxylesterase